jgi:hypothetical protein
MHRPRRPGAGRAVIAATLIATFLVAAGGVHADDLTPQVSDVSPTTVVAVTPELPPTATATVAALPTATAPVVADTPLPTIEEEEGTPLPTVKVEIPTPTARAEPSVATDVLPTVLARPSATAIATAALTSTGVSTGSVTSPVPQVAPLPSPAQLRASARLQFGHGVPHAVRQWAFIIVPVAKRYGLDPMLVAAVITMESDGDPLAWNSGSDARGLMQVLHGPWDPRANIVEGVRMLSSFHAEFPSWNLTLAAYNAGPNAVLSYGGIPPYRETHDYVIVVSYLWDLYANHTLGLHRKAQYRTTLKDLAHFKNERKKVKALATAGGVPIDFALTCAGNVCGAQDRGAGVALPSLDPFWPIASAPDPLQQVNPLGKATP